MKFIGRKEGFTIIEVIVIIAFFGVLFSFVSFNLFGAQRTSSLDSVVNVLVADLKQQQLKSMVGENGVEHGVYVESDKYTLFQGSVYDPDDPQNFVISLPENIVFSGAVDSSILFTKLNGEVDSFPPGGIQIQGSNLSGSETSVLDVNSYGVVSEI